VTVFKVSGDLSRRFIAEGTLIQNLEEKDLCRTQVQLKLPNTDYFLKNPIGNHHIVVPGHCARLLEAFFA
jgi:L-fucose isomerase-like protein